MQYSVLNYTTVKENFDFRIDAEYFDPKYLQLDHILNNKKCVELHEMSLKVSDGTHFTPNYTDQGIPFLSAINVKENYFDIGVNYEFISKEEHKKLIKRCRPSKGDVLLRKVGVGPRWACVVPDNAFEFSIFVSVAQIKPKDISSEYISTFINSKYGQEQLLRFNKGISQPDLHLEDIRRLKIPIINEKIIRITKNIYKKSYEFIENSKSLYSQAEQLLLSELGLVDWKPKRTLAFVKNFSDAQKAERFDAEYFQPKYEGIVDAVKKYKGGFDMISGQFKQNKKFFKKNPNEEYNYIEIGCVNITDGSMEKMKLRGSELPENAKIKLQKDDVIVSKVRPYRGAIGIIDSEDCVGSGAFTVFQENGVVNKETLMVFLRAKPILDFSLKFNTGTSYPTITDEDILNFPLPKIDPKMQEEIKNKINEMYEAKSLSKSLLEIAKRGVEMAIEKDEQEAGKWIEEKLNEIKNTADETLEPAKKKIGEILKS